MNTNKKVVWITRTALFLAVALVAQIIGMNMGSQGLSQILTGTLVNMALIVAGIVVGLSSGAAIAVLSPCLAFLLGIMKFMPAIPVVIAGNLAIVLLTALVYKQFTGVFTNMALEKLIVFLGMALSALVKCAIMWLSALYILPLFVKVPPALVAQFSLPQAITGTLGGLMAVVVLPALLKAKRRG